MLTVLTGLRFFPSFIIYLLSDGKEMMSHDSESHLYEDSFDLLCLSGLRVGRFMVFILVQVFYSSSLACEARVSPVTNYLVPFKGLTSSHCLNGEDRISLISTRLES